MKAEIDVKTTVTVDLSDFPLADLIDEIEERGHRVDDSDLDSASVGELLDELHNRDKIAFAQLDMRELIKALGYAGCPAKLIEELNSWNNEPVPTYAKLQSWQVLATQRESEKL